MGKRRNRQLSLGVIEQVDADSKKGNQDAILSSIKKHYPMTEEEKRALPRGVRLARFVHPGECEHCPLAFQDHTEAWKWPTKVCLKDLRKLERRKRADQMEGPAHS